MTYAKLFICDLSKLYNLSVGLLSNSRLTIHIVSG